MTGTYRKRGVFWSELLQVAVQIVQGRSSTTLRQLHYLVASDPGNGYRNTDNDYKQLSSRTAKARRDGWFPALHEVGRPIYERGGTDSIRQALEDTAHGYQRDYLAGQTTEVWLIVEKGTLLDMACDWTTPYGIPYAALAGYGSQTIMDEIVRQAGHLDGADSTVALYVGDYDPTGVDIERDFADKTGWVWDDIVRLAITEDQIVEYDLPPAPGKTSDPRSAGFAAAHGSLFQVEVEAFDLFHPEVLTAVVIGAIEDRTDLEELRRVKNEETGERDRLTDFMDSFDEDGLEQ